MAPRAPLRVVVAGGGIAALELVLALRAWDRKAFDVTVVSPDPDLLVRAESVVEPFGGAASRYPLAELAGALGFTLVRDRLRAVERPERAAVLASGTRLGYDELVIAVGAAARPAVPGATTFRATAAGELRDAIRELEEEVIQDLVFAAPTGCAWTLPAYELALMAAERGRTMGARGRVALVTYERRPLEIFRGAGSDAVATLLDDAGVRVVTGCTGLRRGPRDLTVGPDDEVLAADRVVALPELVPPEIAGLPRDERGFVAIGATFGVPGAAGVHAVGDAAAYPVKQGGVAAQQADTVAAEIAVRARVRGAASHPFAGRLRAKLLTGGGPLYLSGKLVDGALAASVVTRRSPWWPARKVAGVHLAPFLADVDELGLEAAAARPDDDRSVPSEGPVIHASDRDPGIDLLGREDA